MTLTITDGVLLISDTWINEYILGGDSVDIQYTHNCGDTTTVSPATDDFNGSNQYELPVSTGIYYIKIIKAPDSDTPQTKGGCLSNLTETIRCKVVEKAEEGCDKVVTYYIALQLVNNCTEECDCEKACKIYEELNKILNNECNC